MLLYDWLDYWLLNYKKPKIKNSSYKRLESVVRVCIKPNISSLDLTNASPIDFDICLSKIKSLRNRKYAYNIFTDCFRTAYRKGVISRDFGLFIEPIFYKPNKSVALTLSQRVNFVDYCLRHGCYILLAYFYSGCRKSELLCLRWEHIGFNSLIIPGTKTDNSYRVIPLFSELREILYSQPRINEFVFNITEDELRGMVERARNHLRFYFSIKTLRATFATICFECGIRDNVIAKWLGHTNTHTTYNYYIKVLDDFEKSEALKVNFDY